MDLGLEGKVAVITGGSRGIGAACAALLADEGARLVLAARDRGRLKETAAGLRRQGAEVAVAPADLARKGAADKVAKAALDAFGRIDILVTSAGSAQGGIFWELPDEVWEAAINLKFLGTMRMIRAALPAMRRQKYGRIVVVAGNTGRQPHPRLLPGSTANAALLSLTKGLSEEVIHDGIVINALQPGPAKTEHWDRLMKTLARGSGLSPKRFEGEFLKQIPMGRTARADEMARMIVLLCSDAVAYMTGRSVTLDGGWTKEMA